MTTPNPSGKQIRFRVRLEREPDGKPMYYWVSEKTEVLVVKINNSVKVFNAICPHMGARLGYDPAHQTIRCPWHGLTFSSVDQKSTHFKYRQLAQLEAEVTDGYLIIYG